MDLRAILVSVSNFLNTMIQIFLLFLVFRIVYIYIIGGREYESQPWILFVSVGVAILYFINVGYMSIKRIDYLDTKLLNIDLVYVFSLFLLLGFIIWLVKTFKSVDPDLSDIISLLVLTLTIATNFWAPKVTSKLCKIILRK